MFINNVKTPFIKSFKDGTEGTFNIKILLKNIKLTTMNSMFKYCTSLTNINQFFLKNHIY